MRTLKAVSKIIGNRIEAQVGVLDESGVGVGGAGSSGATRVSTDVGVTRITSAGKSVAAGV